MAAAPAADDAPAGRDRSQYVSEPQQVVLALQAALLRAWPAPQSVAGLVQHTGYSRDQVYRGLVNLALADVAQDTPDGWLIGPAVTAAAERIRLRAAELLVAYLGAPA